MTDELLLAVLRALEKRAYGLCWESEGAHKDVDATYFAGEVDGLNAAVYILCLRSDEDAVARYIADFGLNLNTIKESL
jgi:hypothetical protein